MTNNKNLEIINEFDIKINSLVKYFSNYIDRINIGKISVDLLNEINVKYSKKVLKLNKITSITKENSKTLILNPFDKKLLEIIKNSIISSDLDLKAYIYDKSYIKVICSDMTEERRKKIIKIIKENLEKVKISMRNLKRDFSNRVKKLKNLKEINEDNYNKYNEYFIKIINEQTKYINILIKNKENNLIKI